MEEESNECWQNYSGFELTLNKNRKKKKRNRKAKPQNGSGDIKSDAETLESVDNTILIDDNFELEDTGDDSSKDDVTLRDNADDIDVNRVSLDSMMAVAPEYEEDAKVKIVENVELPESSVDKLYIEDEPLDTVDSKYSLINKRALPKEATTYELENFDKHAMIIFNHKEIQNHLPRIGTEKDVEALTETFTKFRFEVTDHNDKTKDEIFEELKKFSERDFTDYGCVAVAILTHGTNKGMLRAKDKLYSEIEIINHFKDHSKPTLVTKPKIFIIQACRGTKIMTGARVFSFHSGKIRQDHDEEDLEPYILPVESDLLILHSSYPGRASHRHELDGSWFIQTLCKKINTLSPTHDLESIITEIKREVAIDKQHEVYNKRTFEMDVNKQMPVMTSTLIRKLYLVTKDSVVQASEQPHRNNSRQRSDSRHDVLDAASSSIPVTPLLVQFGPCSCFLSHFTYMRNCLRYFCAENPDDQTARAFLGIAEAFEDCVEHNTLKHKMCEAISKHLLENARDFQFYKYLYFYNSQTQPQ